MSRGYKPILPNPLRPRETRKIKALSALDRIADLLKESGHEAQDLIRVVKDEIEER